MSMIQLHDFMSDEWLAEFAAEAQRLLDQSDAATNAHFIYMERMTNAQDVCGASTIGYKMIVEKGVVTLSKDLSGNTQPDCTVVMDYGLARESLRHKSGPPLNSFSATAATSGKLMVEGAPTGLPFSMGAVHDHMCERTQF